MASITGLLSLTLGGSGRSTTTVAASVSPSQPLRDPCTCTLFAVAAVAEEEDCESLLRRRARPARVQHHSSHTSAECSRQILCMRLVYPGVLGERETVVCGPKFVPSEAPIVP